jgi:hypothetical protein
MVSIQMQFSVAHMWMVLQLFDNDTLLYTARGKGTITIPAILLQFVEEPVQVAAVVEKVEKVEKGHKVAAGKPDKAKGDKQDKQVARDAADRRESVATGSNPADGPVGEERMAHWYCLITLTRLAPKHTAAQTPLCAGCKN